MYVFLQCSSQCMINGVIKLNLPSDLLHKIYLKLCLQRFLSLSLASNPIRSLAHVLSCFRLLCREKRWMLGGSVSLLSLRGWLARSSVEFGSTELKHTSRFSVRMLKTQGSWSWREAVVFVGLKTFRRREKTATEQQKEHFIDYYLVTCSLWHNFVLLMFYLSLSSHTSCLLSFCFVLF